MRRQRWLSICIGFNVRQIWKVDKRVNRFRRRGREVYAKVVSRVDIMENMETSLHVPCRRLAVIGQQELVDRR